MTFNIDDDLLMVMEHIQSSAGIIIARAYAHDDGHGKMLRIVMRACRMAQTTVATKLLARAAYSDYLFATRAINE